LSAAAEARRAGDEFKDHAIVTADGLSLYVRDYPAVAPTTGLPVFCLHGLTRNSKDFELVAPRIAALGRRTLAWDTRGRGRSARDQEPARYNAAIYAQDAIRVLDELGIERCVFLGTSMGGLITMVLTTLAPQRIAAAILNDIGPVVDARGLARIAGYVGKGGVVSSWEAAAAAVRAMNGEAFPDADDAFWMRVARRTYRETDRGVLEPDYDPAIANAFAPASDGAPAPAPDLSPLFKNLAGVPVLVVRGATSDILSEDGVAAMRAIKGDLVVAEVPRTGHAPTLEEPEAFDAIVDFLATAP
jgi:pimeloyl-ACP methyl ester carboxylesterase